MPIIGNPLLVGGGGGNISNNDAILVVVAKTGAVITVTKGSVSLTPTMWAWNSDNNYDCALFVVPSNMFDAVNAWTVSATLSGNVNSKTIIIDSAKEYEVSIDYEYIILSSSTTAGIGNLTKLSTGSPPAFAVDSANSRWGVATATNSNVGGFLYYLRIDLTSFSLMQLTYDGLAANNYRGGHYGIYVMSGDSTPIIITSGNDPRGAPSAYEATDRKTWNDSNNTQSSGTFSIDVSSYSGFHYIGFSLGRASIGAGARLWGGWVKDWRLE